MSIQERRRFLAAMIGGLAGAAGGQVLARTSAPVPNPEEPVDGDVPVDPAERADRLAAETPLDAEAANDGTGFVSAFANGGFRKGGFANGGGFVNGGFRKGGFANGGGFVNGGFRKGGFRNW